MTVPRKPATDALTPADLAAKLKKVRIDQGLIDAILPIFIRRRAMRAFPALPSKTLVRKSLQRLSKLTKALRAELESTPASADLELGGKDARGNNIYLAIQFRLKDFDGIVDRALHENIARKVGAPSDVWSWVMVEELVLMLQDRGWRFKDENSVLEKILTVLLPAVDASIDAETVMRKLVKHKGLRK